MAVAENSPTIPVLRLRFRSGGTPVEQPMLVPPDAMLATTDVTDPAELFEGQAGTQREAHLGRAAVKGFLFGPFREIKDIGGEIKQAFQDHRSVSKLVRETKEAQPDHEVGFSGVKRKLGRAAMKLWYLGPLPAYQIADDSVTYPLYLRVQEQSGSGTAYSVAAAATMGLATVTGFTQRYFEKKKAEMIGVRTEVDDSDNIPMMLDSSVNSALWQVTRKANEPRAEGDPIKIVKQSRIVGYAATYAAFNTFLYNVAERLPGNDWAGFGATLWGVWAIGGAYNGVKEQQILNTPVMETAI